MPSRRDFLRGCGAMVISFAALGDEKPQTPGEFGTHPSHVDPKELDSWIAITSNGKITAFTGKCDFGQGILTAQTQLVAEELCVALGRVHLIECDTAVTPDQGTTSGSQSTPVNFNDANLALAAATAREALLLMATRRFALPESEIGSLRIIDGVITSPAGAKASYWDLIGDRHFDLTLNPAAKRKPASEWTILGKPVPGLDRITLMTGRFEFVQYVKTPRMLHGRVVRPPAMGAKLISVEEQSVQHVPGLVKVVVKNDFVGVVAETQYAAVRAARELIVHWKPAPAPPARESFFEFLQQQPGHQVLGVDSRDTGAEPIRARYLYPYQMHASLGTSCAVADVTPDKATVWSPTQSAYPTRSVIAKLLGMPVEKVRLIYVRGSGCYGLNGADAVSFDAAVLSQAVQRPVRLQYSRHDEMMWENLGAACVVEHRAALDKQGSIRSWDRENWVAALGNRPGYDQPGNVISGLLLGYEPETPQPAPAKPPSGRLRNQSNAVPPYMAGCIDGQCQGSGTIRSERVLTHTVRSPFFTGPLRSPLRIQNTFANECFMDELAHHARMDPVAFRLAHLHDPRLIAVLNKAADTAGWAHMGPGKGVACVAYEGGNGYAALIAQLSVREGVVRVQRFVIAIDCGPVSNPDGLRNQIEGGLLQGMSRALVEEVTWDDKGITSVDWETYRSLRLDCEIPRIEISVVNPGKVPATGAGETAITLVPAAIGNAIFDATGARVRQVPFTPERVRAAAMR